MLNHMIVLPMTLGDP